MQTKNNILNNTDILLSVSSSKKLPQRKSIRLKDYDYSQPGLYFVTICTQNRINSFGHIKNHKMILNSAGDMVKTIWLQTSDYFSNIQFHEFIIMPNHFHAIIEITTVVGADSISARTTDSISARTTDSTQRAEIDSAPTGRLAQLETIVQTFKRYTTIQYIKMVKQNILPPFNKHVWQRNYWEHIIRNKNEYLRISQYIINNPKKWDADKLNGGKGNMVMETQSLYGEELWMI